MNKIMRGAIIAGAAGMAFTSGATALAVDGQALLSKGDQNAQVAQLQLALSEKGLLTGEATGYFGDETQQALIEYQQQNNLTADGIAGTDTLELLLGDQEGSGDTPTLYAGMESSAVTTLQQKLVDLGYLQGTTGYFGTDTEEAVWELQNANGLTADCLVGPATWAVLNSDDVVTQTAANTPLELGMSGKTVQVLQQKLMDLGYLSGYTGYFGTDTQSAVQRFQTYNGLTADGKVGAATRVMLYSADATTAAEAAAALTATPSGSSTTSGNSILTLGCSGDVVAKAQQLLIQHGYLSGSTGYFGTDTEQAVRLFQSYNGLTADGTLGEATWDKLAGNAVSYADGIEGQTGSSAMMDVSLSNVLKSGETSDVVTAIQERLIELGYLQGTTGYYGSDTVAAIEEFQAYNALTIDGNVGDATLAALGSASAVSHSTGEAASAAASATSAPVAEDDLEVSGVLKSGETSDVVTAIQERLIELGYLQGTTGYFGSDTVAAIEEFQASNGLTIDGEVGESTLEKLNSSSAVTAAQAAASNSTDGAQLTLSGEEVSGVLKSGSAGDTVEDIQQRLIALGYLQGSTGYFGSDTVSAIQAFQAANGLTADGEVGESTLEKLNSGSAVTAAQAAASQSSASSQSNASSGGEVSASGTLKLGSSGNDVTTLQQRLVELGYLTGYTSYFGSDTVAAVKEFQTYNDLTADGEVGESTLAAINSSSAVTRSAGSGSGSGSSNESTGTAGSSSSSSGTLQRGDSGDAVTKAQKRLIELGYLSGSTGYFGSATENAIKSFQENSGLTADGKLGSATEEALYSSDAESAGSGSSSSGSSDSGSTSQSSSFVERLISAAKSKLGCSYVWGGSGPSVFDCSGLVYWCLNQSGVSVDRYSAAGFASVGSWQTISSTSNLQRGDLLFWSTSRASVGHTGIYLGDGQYIHASSSAGQVTISSMGSWSYSNFVRAKRVR